MKFFNSKCIKCIFNKYTGNIPNTVDEETSVRYIKRVLAIIAGSESNISAPEVVEEITKAQIEILGIETDYSKEKKYYNDLILSVEDKVYRKICESPDPFIAAMNYSFAGNYIDFGTVAGVQEDKLIKLLDNAQKLNVSAAETENLRREVLSAGNIVYLIDNCGEIVLDKLFIKEIKRQNPAVAVSVITRGAPVLNDCTKEDARSIGLAEFAKIISNGTAVAGTCLGRISSEAKAAIDSADLIVSKGQGNFETLSGCGKNIYYLFLCKCEKFSDAFGVPQMSAMLINEKRVSN